MHEVITIVSGLNECCWTFISRLDTLQICFAGACCNFIYVFTFSDTVASVHVLELSTNAAKQGMFKN